MLQVALFSPEADVRLSDGGQNTEGLVVAQKSHNPLKSSTSALPPALQTAAKDE